jgi:hypothetical protein
MILLNFKEITPLLEILDLIEPLEFLFTKVVNLWIKIINNHKSPHK